MEEQISIRSGAARVAARGGRRLLMLFVLFSILLAGCGRESIDLARRGHDAGLRDGGSGDGSGVPAIAEAGAAETGANRNAPHCDAAHPDCSSIDGVCLTSERICVHCTSDTQCAPRGITTLHCDTTTHGCVECAKYNDCAPPFVCEKETSRCALPCSPGGPDVCGARPHSCDASRGLCTECRTDDDCLQEPMHDTRFQWCVAGHCRQCNADRDCINVDTPRCEPNEGRCVGCLDSRDCPGSRCNVAKKTCDAATL